MATFRNVRVFHFGAVFIFFSACKAPQDFSPFVPSFSVYNCAIELRNNSMTKNFRDGHYIQPARVFIEQPVERDAG